LQENHSMLRAGLPFLPKRRLLRPFASLCAAGAVLLPAGCQINLPMNRLPLNGVAAPTPLSSGRTPPLQLTVPEGEPEENSAIQRTAYKAKATTDADPSTLPAPDTLPSAVGSTAIALQGVPVNFDIVMRRTFENNGDILVSRARVDESQIALDAALRSCMPEALRKDTFKKPVAEATVWRRRAELRKVERDNLQDAANAYFDWLTALRGEAVTRELMNYDEQLLDRARRLAKTEKPAQVIVESIESALDSHRQALENSHYQVQGLAANLANLMGLNGPLPATNETLEPMDRVDTSVAVEVLVRQSQENGPSVRELQGLAASIQQGIDSARMAQSICAHTGAPLVCGRLQIAQSQLQQAQLSLFSLQNKLRAGVEEAYAAIIQGREQINHAFDAIQHAKESYRLTKLRLEEEGPDANRRNNTYTAVLTTIRQLTQTNADYLKAINAYNKAQARLLLLLGNYPPCPPNAP
jgi:hypothetical protein